MSMMISTGPVLYSSLGVGDTIVLFLLALVVFGPKRLPEIGRQIGKIYGEFRRASNEFKFQIEDELRKSEDTERQNKLAANTPPTPAAPVPQIMPPSTGEIIPQREAPREAAEPEHEPAQASLSLEDPAEELPPHMTQEEVQH